MALNGTALQGTVCFLSLSIEYELLEAKVTGMNHLLVQRTIDPMGSWDKHPDSRHNSFWLR